MAFSRFRALVCFILLILSNAATVSSQIPFVCDGEAYVVHTALGQLIQIDQTSDPFAFQNIGPPAGFVYNNIGFRRTDGLIYGARTFAPFGIVTIDAAGTVTDLGVPPGLPPDRYNAGAVTRDGNTMYINVSPRPTPSSLSPETGPSYSCKGGAGWPNRLRSL